MTIDGDGFFNSSLDSLRSAAVYLTASVLPWRVKCLCLVTFLVFVEASVYSLGNVFGAPRVSLIAPGQFGSGTQNVWCPEMTL